MDADLYKKVKNIVSQIWDSPNDMQSSLLDELCEKNLQLRKEVEIFLFEEVNDNFLAQGPVEINSEECDNLLTGKVGRIKILHQIATGGMGEVYAGVDEVLKRDVAVKIMNAGMRLSIERRHAFLNEAQVLSSLQHPNICQIYDFFEDQDRDVLVLELIQGKTLSQLTTEDSIKNPINIAIQIVAALTTAHERGIIHRETLNPITSC